MSQDSLCARFRERPVVPFWFVKVKPFVNLPYFVSCGSLQSGVLWLMTGEYAGISKVLYNILQFLMNKKNTVYILLNNSIFRLMFFMLSVKKMGRSNTVLLY